MAFNRSVWQNAENYPLQVNRQPRWPHLPLPCPSQRRINLQSFFLEGKNKTFADDRLDV